MDYPLVRAQHKCVACDRNDKDTGLLLHWECHRQQKALHDPAGDYSARVWHALDTLEAKLEVTLQWHAHA